MLKHYKKALDYFIDKNEGCAYSLDFYFADELAKHLNIPDIDTIELLHQMAADGYLEYNTLQCGDPYGVHLSYKGLNYKNHSFRNLCRYISEKWIDFLALIVSIIALIISITK